MIRFEGVSYRFEEGTLGIDDLTFSLPEGEFTGLLASNGGGKTTLLRLAAGLIGSTRGRVFLAGRPMEEIPDRERYTSLGFVMQNPRDQLIAPTVAEDIAFGPRNLGLPEEEVSRLVAEALDICGIEDIAERETHRISFGEARRAAMAGILAMRPSVLLLDEPTSGLDPDGEAKLLALLKRLNREEGKTILMATHTIDLLPVFLDRLIVLSRGRVVADGRPAEVFGDPETLLASGLRLPYVSRLMDELRAKDGLDVESALTIGEARRRIVESFHRARSGRIP